MPSPKRAALALMLVPVLALAACGEDEKTPEEARYERVRDRLEASFSDKEAECMLDQLSDSVLVALDAEGQLPQGDDLTEFTEVARACVLSGGVTTTTAATTTTTSTPESTSSEPEGGSTTAPGDGGGEESGGEGNGNGNEGNGGQGNGNGGNGNGGNGNEGNGDGGRDDAVGQGSESRPTPTPAG